jgi:hypothetical protein
MTIRQAENLAFIVGTIVTPLLVWLALWLTNSI